MSETPGTTEPAGFTQMKRTADPSDIIDALHRYRDVLCRITDPYDLGRHAHRDIRRAAHEALAGKDPTPTRPQEPRR